MYFNGVALDAADRGRGPYIWRFTVVQRALHGVLVVAFFVLAYTGLPLRFSCIAWAPKLMALWGGSFLGFISRRSAPTASAMVRATNLVLPSKE